MILRKQHLPQNYSHGQLKTVREGPTQSLLQGVSVNALGTVFVIVHGMIEDVLI